MARIIQNAGTCLLYITNGSVNINLGWTQQVEVHSTRQKTPVNVIGSSQPAVIQKGGRSIYGQMLNTIVSKSLFADLVSQLVGDVSNNTVTVPSGSAVFKLKQSETLQHSDGEFDTDANIVSIYKNIKNTSGLTQVNVSDNISYSTKNDGVISNWTLQSKVSDMVKKRAPIYIDELRGFDLKIYVPLETVSQKITYLKSDGEVVKDESASVLLYQLYVLEDIEFYNNGIQIQPDQVQVMESIRYAQHRQITLVGVTSANLPDGAKLISWKKQ